MRDNSPPSASRGPAAAPIRGEILSRDQLAERIRVLAQSLDTTTRRSERRPLLERLKANRKALAQARAVFDDAVHRGIAISPAAEWLLDNEYLVTEHARQAQRDLSHGFYRQLPRVVRGHSAGDPRVYELALEIIAAHDSVIDQHLLETCVHAYQSVCILTSGEIWAIAIMLRLGLIENLRRLMDQSVVAQQVRAAADRRVDTILHTPVAPGTMQRLVATIPGGAEWETLFLVEMLERLRDVGPAAADARAWLEQRLVERGTDSESVVQLEHRRTAANRVTAGNIITSFRALASIDWRRFFENVSRVDELLRLDPAGVYPKMDFATRDRYRHVVEQVSRRSNMTEITVATHAVRAATEAKASGGSGHLGEMLIGDGVEAFRTRLGIHPTQFERMARWCRARGPALYILAMAAVTVAIVAVLCSYALDMQASLGRVLLTLAVVLVPATALAEVLIHSLAAGLAPPRVLPKLDFEAGIDPTCSTMVVIPVLLSERREVQRLLDDLEIRFLGNRDSHLYFALLTDFAHAGSAEIAADAPLLEALRRGIDDLNARYAPEARDRFHLFHRRRTWNPVERVWMGWERKRGKLMEFNRLLRGAADTSFAVHVGVAAVRHAIRYVITLDADTELPPASAPRLVGTIAHPLNRPRLDSDKRVVTHGYGVVQPRTSISARAATATRWAHAFASDIGLSPYANAVGSVYQDLFGSGSFMGKGIYDVDIMNAVLEGRFPPNRLLSHDLLEGAHARTAFASDVQLMEGFPATFDAFERREHRWVRGDWQILDWLTPRVPGEGGDRRSNPLRLLDRWKIFDNLRRSLVLPALAVLLGAGWLVLPGSPWVWTAVALFVLIFPNISSATGSANARPLGEPWWGYLWAVADQTLLELRRAFLTVTFALAGAIRNLDALLRALVRVTITRRRLLEWDHSAAVERGPALGVWGYVRRLWLAPLLALACLVLLVRVAPATLWVASPILGLWIASPLLAWWVSLPRSRREQSLTAAEREQLRAIARRTWAFYERFAAAEDNWLPPDNFQEEPGGQVAHRTSPTNIAFLLLSGVAARDLGFIDLDEFVTRTERVFATLERLDHYRGHLLNWYDTVSLQPLQPAYISTADSGNFAAALLALEHVAREFAAESAGGEAPAVAARAQRLHAIARLARSAYEAMDFRFLYDDERRHFVVGFNAVTGQRDASYYDLLASEARLASFIAVARGQVPIEHWFKLGRPLTRDGRRLAVLSWGGTMFEYLLPALFMRAVEGTLLRQTYDTAIHRQIAYGRRHGVPWGVSESGFNAVDFQQAYQYRMFGVPELALRRDPTSDVVIAPYATFLALLVAPRAAWKNLQRLEREGLLGAFGYYEAIDYTPSRRPRDRRGGIVQSYMAHHAGMSLVAIAHVVHGERIRRGFHADPAIATASALLQEELPRHAPLAATRPDGDPVRRIATVATSDATRTFMTAHTPAPRGHVLSNGNYSVLVTNAGGGSSGTRETALTRWRPDATRDCWGSFVYIRDLARDDVWSNFYQPTRVDPRHYQVHFGVDKVECLRRDFGVETHTEIAVSPQDDLEIRRLNFTAHQRLHCALEVTSFAEVALDSPHADVAHPAFSKLFVESEALPDRQAVLFRRRPRQGDERPLWAFHQLVGEDFRVEGFEWETDRKRFLGRGRAADDPRAIWQPLSGTTGAVLDPVMSLRARIKLVPERTQRLVFVTGIAASREEALARCDAHRDLAAIDRVFDLAAVHAQIELRHLGISGGQAQTFQRLASRLLCMDADLRADASTVSANTQDRSALWSYGISGDHPIILGSIAGASELDLVRELLVAHEYWRRRGLRIDLVLLNEHPTTYADDLQNRIQATVDTSLSRPYLDKPGGVFCRRADHWRAEDRVLLRTVAGVVLKGDLGSIDNQLKLRQAAAVIQPKPVRPLPSRRVRRAFAPSPTGPVLPADLRFPNGRGGFSSDGREYMVRVDGEHFPPAPWINVLANPRFGCLASEAGLGTTWSRNSQQNRLTPWSNDPVSDPPSEVVYVCDDEHCETWSLTPLPLRTRAGHRVRHGAGYTIYESSRGAIDCELCVFVAAEAPVKIVRVRLHNRSPRTRTLKVVHTAQWVLGTSADNTRPFLQAWLDMPSQAIFARNTSSASGVAFTASSHPLHDWMTDRCDFLGRNGTAAEPRGLGIAHWPIRAGADTDPFAALRCVVTIDPDATGEVVFFLGEDGDQEKVRAWIQAFREPGRVEAELQAVRDHWDRTLGAIEIATPDPKLDVLVNRWLPYQVLGCRVWGRTAFYQSGGAYGFRDQLQDVMALVHTVPQIAHAHLLRAAAHQFKEGDVLHWWHEPQGTGVRTRCSDDLVWLPFATMHYVQATGDTAILDTVVPFLDAPPLDPDQHEEFLSAIRSVPGESLYEHCVRALVHSEPLGAHQLPLIGSGDWNDGMNRLGHHGRGESVWLGWFLHANLTAFARLAGERGDTAHAKRFADRAAALRKALDEWAWDGAWYRRAYDDEGRAVGTATSSECRIDSIAQSWSVLSGAAPQARARAAMDAVDHYLVRDDQRLILLLDPPFDFHGSDPGYIQGYVPGVRENGGQYTHAAIWAVWANLRLQRADRGFQLLQMLNPIEHAADSEGVARYQVEPYVVAADVYSEPTHRGRGGWTWYTGSAAWLWRVTVEALLGLDIRGNRMRFAPALPSAWNGFRLTYRRGTTRWIVMVEKQPGAHAGVDRLFMDGTELRDDAITLVEDGSEHEVRVVLAAASSKHDAETRPVPRGPDDRRSATPIS